MTDDSDDRPKRLGRMTPENMERLHKFADAYMAAPPQVVIPHRCSLMSYYTRPKDTVRPPRELPSTTLGQVRYKYGHIPHKLYWAAHRLQSRMLDAIDADALTAPQSLADILKNLDEKLGGETRLERVKCYKLAREATIQLIEGHDMSVQQRDAFFENLTWYPALDQAAATIAKDDAPQD